MPNRDDEVWNLLAASAERLTLLSTDTVTVWPFRRWRPLRISEGLDFGDNWVAGEPEIVRWRRPWSSKWHDDQPIGVAAATIETFLRERPDL